MSKDNSLKVSDIAYDQIKKAIINKELQPGQKLGKRDMAKLCGVSTIPVIEALVRLEMEGFIESNPYSGSRVIVMNDERLKDLLILRESIEVQIAWILCFSISMKEGKDFLKEAEEIDKLTGLKVKSPEYDKMHYNFHIGLAKACQSDSLVKELSRIHLFSLLEKSEEQYSSIPHQFSMDQYTHVDIISSILRRNPVEAQKIMRRHIYRSHIIEVPFWV